MTTAGQDKQFSMLLASLSSMLTFSLSINLGKCSSGGCMPTTYCPARRVRIDFDVLEAVCI
jgi:hypothetical protein